MLIQETKNGIEIVIDAGGFNASIELDNSKELKDFFNELIGAAEKKFKCTIDFKITDNSNTCECCGAEPSGECDHPKNAYCAKFQRPNK